MYAAPIRSQDEFSVKRIYHITWVPACGSHEAFEMVLKKGFELGSIYVALLLQPEA
jgi:hypothetical protein